MSLTEKVFATTLAGVVLAGGYFGIVKPLVNSSRFNTAYQNALLTYADTNKDGFVTAAERDAFDIAVLKDKGVTLLPNNMPHYKNGETVPTPVVTDWIKNYRPSN